MDDQEEIITTRLILKSVSPVLIHKLFTEKTQEEITKFFGVDEAGYARLKTMHENGMETSQISLFYFLLVEKESKKIVGECGFHSWNKIHRRADLFYNLKSDHDKRKGLMSEALDKVLDYGFSRLKLHRIAAFTAKNNVASINLLKRFKFQREGTIREDYVVDSKNEDSECFSLLKWEWKQNID